MILYIERNGSYIKSIRQVFFLTMKIQQQHKSEIRDGFSKMKSRLDLLKLLNQAKEYYYEGASEIIPIQLKSLTYYSNPNLAKERYKEFTIRKKSGGLRKIHAPVSGLKTIQKVLNYTLNCIFNPHEAAKGFVINQSIVGNASQHVGNNYVFNIDLKDFFSSIDLHRVKAIFKLPPFNLDNEREPLAFLLANICCTSLETERMINGVWEKKVLPVLPQGAPTSPTITNIICFRLDQKLNVLAKRFNLKYSRYADDITFSSIHNVYQPDSDFIKELNQIINQQHFHVNPLKTRLQRAGFRQEVTGIVVNEKPNVHERYVKRIRMWLHYWEKYGYEKAEQIFQKDYSKDKGHVKKSKPAMINVISGKLEYLKMVKGNENALYLKLSRRFDVLVNKYLGFAPLDKILDTWESDGIEKAMGLIKLNTKK